jgi:hypothetical protein
MSDVLNKATESAVFLRQAQVTRLINVGNEPPIQLRLLRVDKSSVVFALPVAEGDLSHKSLYRRAVRQTYEIVVGLPGFELRGEIHLTERFDLRRVLVTRTEDFIPLTNATATYVLYPRVSVSAGTIVFNKAMAGLLAEIPPGPGAEPQLGRI